MSWWLCDCGQACHETQETCGHCGGDRGNENAEPTALEALRDVWTAFFRKKMPRPPSR